MFRNYLSCLLFTLLTGTLFSQATITGIIIDGSTQKPVSGVVVRTSLPDNTVTDSEGKFSVKHLKGDDILLYLDWNGQTTEFSGTTTTPDATDLGEILLTTAVQSEKEQDLPTITLDDNDENEDINISGLLQSGDDLFGSLTNYTFSPARFNRRGLEAEYSDGYLNNLPINDLESGGVYWSNWGGLNDVMRQDAEVIGAEQSDWGFGGVASTFNTDLRAASQWRQKRFSYAVTNRNYRNRIMGTWSTGLLSSGWAFSFSGSRRWSHEGYIPGTFYDGWSYFGSVSKKLSDRHSLNLVALGAPYKRGGSSTAIQEMYDLANDHYYNSYWGYQEGKKRNQRVYSGHQPLFILRHDWTLGEKLSVTSSIGYQSGENSTGALDWLNANDPRPDYYRRLPSYVDDPVVSEQMRALLSANESLRQIQWDKLYEVNLHSNVTIENADGIEGNNVTGALSQYILEERHSDIDKKSGNIVLQFLPSDNSQFLLGVNVVIQNTHNFKEVGDLLGGEFYVDWDKFAAEDFPGNDNAQQNDLRRPNRILHEGDQFGYDYFSKMRQQSAWLSYKLNTNKWEAALGGSIKNHIYWRDGQTQNGKFPDNSFGESQKNKFLLPAGKALLRYKFDGRNYLTVSGVVAEMAPSFRNAYVSPRTRDNVVKGLEKQNVQSGEIRYDLKAPYFKFSLAGYFVTTKHGIESYSFYNDDAKTFVNFSLTNIDKQNKGIEGAFDYVIIPGKGISIHGAASVAQNIYTSRPLATITQDNDGSVLVQNIIVYAKNLYVSGSPQTAYTAGLTYKTKHFMTFYLDVNRYEDSYVDFNPVRRTNQGVDLVEPYSPRWNEILQQEKLDPAWTVDFSFYKSWLVNWPLERTSFALNISVGNLLNNTDYISNGFEQLRYDFAEKDPNTFPAKYSYMQGLNFFIQGSMKF
ncbi:MAG TPA: hypothetical protein VFG10_18100 [Saprospiraceae bacterium]|nr:hypothetical protein [Saprospiraceae bacterium]